MFRPNQSLDAPDGLNTCTHTKMDLKSTLLVVGGSACSFKLLNAIIKFLPTPEPARKKAWRWRNISTSLAHSSLAGTWAVLCFYLQPQMAEDLISSHSLLSHSLVAVSIGYFIHDSLDVALNQSCKQSWEVLLHHSVVLSCFSLAVTSRLYVGYAVVSLLVEINSVFLHVRQLLLLSGRRSRPGSDITAPRPSVAYSVTSWLNLGTLLVFRVCTLGWMTRWLAAHSEFVPLYVLMTGTVSLSVISIMNIVLFYRLLRADLLSSTHNTSKDH
ncbi:TLC domain-containing protein 2-like [Plectropomus leopardus]|uniref:TLC domain-containing protein 2-like n=1 Tax=Plectropomus leopardus TaxID=160734 RepID=UPI001C4D0036|nr:TLC domain-containing protein 2-like [Plectropomus leopardus]